MNGDNELSHPNDTTECTIMKSQNTDQNIDANGANIMKVCVDLKEDTNTNGHNNEPISPPSNASNSLIKNPSDNPHQEIRVYGTVKVHNQILDLWLYEAEMRRSYVSVPKLSDKDIQRWTNSTSAKPSWQDLDPYSSLEEIVSDDDTNIQSDTATQLYNMCERKPKNIIGRSHRKRKEIDYTEFCDDNSDPPSPKRPRQ